MNSRKPSPYVQVALPLPLPVLFDYRIPEGHGEILCGTRVLAPFGKRKLVGVVVGSLQESQLPEHRIVTIERVLDGCKPLLNSELLDLLKWCWRYYKHAPGEVVFNALPPVLRKPSGLLPPDPVQYRITEAGREALAQPPGRSRLQHQLLALLADGPGSAESLRAWKVGWRKLLAAVMDAGWVVQESELAADLQTREGLPLTPGQQLAVDAVVADLGRFRCHLLDGITGSGKTEIYLCLIEQVIRSGRQVLVLVPEIGLTPQLLRRFSKRLGLQPSLYHSGMAAGPRAESWAAARSGRAKLILGTRSALFLSLQNPGLIILDESHDNSFNQQDGFRFSARDVAVKRAADANIPIVLGTATPALETLHNARQGRYRWNRLRERPTGAGSPAWIVQDMRSLPATGGLVEPVLEHIARTLSRNEQVLVFLNRRGYAPVLLCHECGWHAACHRCDANLTWHRAMKTLDCHHCGHRQRVPDTCPQCLADALHGAGEGTQQLEQVLAARFNGVELHRFDRDQVTRKGAFEQMYDQVRNGGPCILVGTQMLAKGHHFPSVTLVVIVNLDQALYSADFRAMERMGQLMIQVAGRAGREDRPGAVILQTHHPDHPLLEELLSSGYEGFASLLLEERRVANLPPYSFQAALRAEAGNRDSVMAFLNDARDRYSSEETRLYGPFPALMEKRSGRVRWYLLLQGSARSAVQACLDTWLPEIRRLSSARQVRWAIDVDPQEF